MDKVKDCKAKYHIEILVVLKDVQQQHGLRHKDYRSYHQYVTRKLHRMRKSLNFPQGKGNRVIPKKLTKSVVTESRYLLVKLFEAERAWARAMQLKTDSSTEPRKVYHMRRRLTKAVQKGRELWELCKWDRCDEHKSEEKCEQCAMCDMQTYVEAQAYYFGLQALRFFELGEWQNAKNMYERALREYSGLCEAVDEEHRPLYEARVEEMRPLIRYCATNIDSSDSQGGSSAVDIDVDQPEELLRLQTYRNKAVGVTEVRWLGCVIPVRSEVVRVALVALEEADRAQAGLEDRQERVVLCDSVLKTCGEALACVREEIKVAGLPVPATTGAAPSELGRPQLLYLYLQYRKLTRTMERNLLLIAGSGRDSTVKPQSMARLYDTVCQNLQELLQLVPALAEEGAVQTRLTAYRALRCHHLSQAHLQMRHHAECAALLARAMRHAREAVALLAGAQAGDAGEVEVEVPGPGGAALAEDMRALIEALQADQLACRASQCLLSDVAMGGEAELLSAATATTVPLWSRLDAYSEESPCISSKRSGADKMIDSPPEFAAIPVKPVLFDLAFYHVQYPGLEDKVARADAGSGKGGLSGIVKGWIWGSGK